MTIPMLQIHHKAGVKRVARDLVAQAILVQNTYDKVLASRSGEVDTVATARANVLRSYAHDLKVAAGHYCKANGLDFEKIWHDEFGPAEAEPEGEVFRMTLADAVYELAKIHYGGRRLTHAQQVDCIRGGFVEVNGEKYLDPEVEVKPNDSVVVAWKSWDPLV